MASSVALATSRADRHATAEQVCGYLGALLESAGDAITSGDFTGKMLSWNHAAEVFYAYSEKEAVGEVLPMVPEGLLPEARSIIGRCQKGETIRNIETVRRRSDGRLIPVSVTAAPVLNGSGEVVAACAISRDISATKALREQELKMARLNERDRIGMDLHDGVVQSLYAISLRLENCITLLTTAPHQVPPSLEKAIAELKDVSQDITHYVDGLNGSALTVKDLPGRVASFAAGLHLDAHIVIERPLSSELDATLSARSVENILHIVREALTNVAKHSQARATQIRLSEQGDKLVLSIKDDGAGFIGSCDIAKLGHGLRNMSHRAQTLGGCLAIKTTPGIGTELLLELPL
ncbi:MAG: PAS domain S-box protein [Chloroflexi bacterium]|nr:PAS domain S-box protein [Chloroflexota bacterium]